MGYPQGNSPGCANNHQFQQDQLEIFVNGGWSRFASQRCINLIPNVCRFHQHIFYNDPNSIAHTLTFYSWQVEDSKADLPRFGEPFGRHRRPRSRNLNRLRRSEAARFVVRLG